jgi:hypothetical protein
MAARCNRRRSPERLNIDMAFLAFTKRKVAHLESYMFETQSPHARGAANEPAAAEYRSKLFPRHSLSSKVMFRSLPE